MYSRNPDSNCLILRLLYFTMAMLLPCLEMTSKMQYLSHYAYLKRAPTIYLWWPLPIFLVTIVIASEPLFIHSSYELKVFSLISIFGFAYLTFLNINRNEYLKRTVLSLSFLSNHVELETLNGIKTIIPPCSLSPVSQHIRNRHKTTFPDNTELYEISTDNGIVYLSSRTDGFDMVLKQLEEGKRCCVQ